MTAVCSAEREHHRRILGALGLVHRKRIGEGELVKLIGIVEDLLPVEGNGGAAVISGCARGVLPGLSTAWSASLRLVEPAAPLCIGARI
jgi:hypothetical protein